MRLTLCLLLALALPAPALTIVDADVCVYGGTSGGVIAAVQARRLGKTASLAVFSHHLGGLTSGGLGATDTGNATAIQGVSREFYTRIGQHYGTAGARFNFEPHVARDIYLAMLAEAGVAPRYHQRLASVTKVGQRITEIAMEDGTIYRAAMFIDATYEGDLMAMAGVSFTVGRESVAQYGESLNGIRATTPSHQFTVNVDPYVVPGNAASGLLPHIAPGDGGTPGDGDARVQAYNYRMCLTTNAANRLPIPAPPGYDPASYELLRRLIVARLAAGHTLTLGSFMNVAGMPNSKTDINNNGAFSTDMIGANYAYPNGTYAQREAIELAHRNYIQGFLYFLGTHPDVPAAVRTAMLNYGFCADEYDGGFSPQIYVREARRMVSDYVMQQQNCQGSRTVTDSVGLGSYTMDSHNCQRVVQGGFARNEGDVQSGTPAPYSISYRSIVPKVGEAENLFVPFALSASHIAFGSIRMEPVFMITAQSAATAAAFAIDDGVAVQGVSYAKLAAQLVADGQMLTWGSGASTGTIVDNTDATGVAYTGSWIESSATAGYWGSNYRHDNNELPGTKSVRYTPNLATAANYEVYARWTQHTNRATAVPIDVNHAGGTTTYTVNQQSNGAAWVLLGTHAFAAGTAGNVLLRTTGANGYVIADAFRFVAPGAASADVQLVASDAVAGEGGNPARFTVVRTGDTGAALAVNLAFAGTATAGTDYTGAVASVTIPAGSLSASFTVAPVADALAEGSETVSVAVQPGAGYNVIAPSAAAATLLDRPFDAWRFANFTAAELANPAISGADADADGDGLSNLAERAFARGPKSAEATAPPLAVLAGGNLTLTYTRAKAALADTTFTGQWAAAPGTAWQTAGLTETLLADDGTLQTVRLSLPATGQDQRFLRVRLLQL